MEDGYQPNITENFPEDGYEAIMNIAYNINKYYLWVILAFGLPGNAAAIYTIFCMRHLGSFGFYVVLLAVVDSMAIIAKVLNYQLLANHVKIYAVGCKLIFFLANYLITFANWILVLMAVERLLAVKFPLKILRSNYKYSVVASIVVGVILAAPYLPIFWNMTYDDQAFCVFNTTDESLMTFLFWTHRSLYGFIPFIILLVSNLFITNIIRNSFRFRNEMRPMTRTNSSGSSSTPVPENWLQRQIMLLLFTTTFVFVLLNFPLCAYTVAVIYWRVDLKTNEDAIQYLLKQLAHVMCDSNHAINFYLYFFSARKFRAQFIRHSIFSSSFRGRGTRV